MVIKYLFAIGWFFLIVFASLFSPDKIPDLKLFPHADKVIHFSLYNGLSFLLIPALTINKNYKQGYLISFVLSVVTGIFMESFQYLIANGRSAEFFDFIANLIGSITGIIMYHIFLRNKKWENKIFKT